jgi:hypothetical protein
MTTSTALLNALQQSLAFIVGPKPLHAVEGLLWIRKCYVQSLQSWLGVLDGQIIPSLCSSRIIFIRTYIAIIRAMTAFAIFASGTVSFKRFQVCTSKLGFPSRESI